MVAVMVCPKEMGTCAAAGEAESKMKTRTSRTAIGKLPPTKEKKSLSLYAIISLYLPGERL